MALIRLRLVLVGVMAVALAVAAGRVFDRVEPVLLLGAVLPTVAAVTTVGQPIGRRVVAGAAAVVVAVVAAVALTGGRSPADVGDATRGVARLLSTEWPSPRTPDLVGTVTLAIAVATSLAVALVAVRRSHLAPLVPLLGAFVAVAGASAPAGPAVGALGVAAVAAVLFALVGRDTQPGDRARLLAERGLLPTLGAAAVVALAVALGLSITARADPREDDPPVDEVVELDPVEAVEALRAIEPPIELYRVGVGDGPVPARWRTAAVDVFDGEQWRADVTLRPIGRRLGPAGERTRAVDVEFLTDDLDLVVLPGAAVTVDGSVATDPGRTVVRATPRPGPGDRLDGSADVAALPADAAGRVVGTRPVDERAAAFTSTARGLITPGTVLAQVQQLAEVMRTEFALDPDAPGAGVQQALMERFVRDTRRGSAEQFVTGFVLLARSLGVDARVASGFVVPEDELAGGDDVVLRSDMAAVWPEVRVEGLGWVPFDPVPPDEASDLAPQSPPPVRQTPVAPQPPVVPPVEPVNETPEPDEPEAAESSGPWGSIWRWTARVGLASLSVVVPLAVVAFVILWRKARRRRRLLGAPSPDERARGAWALATDAVTDAGVTIDRAWTDHDVVDASGGVAGDARAELRELAALSGTATFGPGFTDDPTPRAVACLDVVERAVLAPRSRRQRLRYRLSTRSLRRRTRSPVSAALG